MPQTASAGTLRDLDKVLLREAERIEDLLAYHRNQVRCPVYTSIDIRRNACKAAVVDANAFPAGFNNLARRSIATASDAVQNYMERTYPGAGEFLILAEGHTRNKWYFQNLHALERIFEGAGFAVTLGTLNEELWPRSELETALGDTITLHGVLREGDDVIADGIVPDVVVLNNDLSSGPPDILDGLRQPITPPPSMGWHRRSKGEHFRIVGELARQLGDHAGFDPWCISAEFEQVSGIDFKAREGLDEVAAAVDRVVARVAAKYDQYGIDDQPTVFVKADSGTYGMGVMTARSGEEFLRLNSKGRERMSTGKERKKVEAVIVQEGVPTDVRAGTEGRTGRKGRSEGDATRTAGGGVGGPEATAVDGPVAEPVMYMVCGRVVGGFNRIHEKKGEMENLNAPGSEFQPYCFVTQGDGEPGPDETLLDPVSAHVYQVIGEIASIATGYELRFQQEPEARLPTYP